MLLQVLPAMQQDGHFGWLQAYAAEPVWSTRLEVCSGAAIEGGRIVAGSYMCIMRNGLHEDVCELQVIARIPLQKDALEDAIGQQLVR